MEATSEPVQSTSARSETAELAGIPAVAEIALAPSSNGAVLAPAGIGLHAAWRGHAIAAAMARARIPIAVYFATRLLLLAVALVDEELRHRAFTHELANWDGMWFRELASNGYPTHVAHVQTTLGFFPLYPMAMWLVAHLASAGTMAEVGVVGVIISVIGGLVATLLVQRLATGWWGEESGRRAAVIFSLFPGSVVFSMVYSEGLLLPLAAGCILALERRRWILAGVLAGVATAAQPDALALVPVCALSAVLELRRRGWRDRRARRSLLAPVLSLTGVVAFAAFLWAWTGTPLANYEAQHYGWGEKTDPLALVHQVRTLANEISFAHSNRPTINLNLIAGLLGTAFLLTGLVLLFRRPRRVSTEALAWTVCIGLLALTSEYVPPNPRLLITAFPVVLVFAHHFRRRAGSWLLLLNGVLLSVTSYLTFVGPTLRP